MQTTVIIPVYNEEYLLPFWLEYHKNIFDNIIVTNYHCTDSSIDIVKKICPNAIIYNTVNSDYDAINHDIETMNIETHIQGFKILLNVTEFLICDKPLKEILSSYKKDKVCIPMVAYAPYSEKRYDNIKSYHDIFKNLVNDNFVYDTYESRIGHRFLHNHNHGNYHPGRHTTNIQDIEAVSTSLHVLWLGYYPLNDDLIKRKIQIQYKRSVRDKQLGLGFHHETSKEKILEIIKSKCKSGKPLIELNPNLNNIIINMVNSYN